MPEHSTVPPRQGANMPADRIAGVVLAAAGFLLAWQSLRLPLGTVRDPGAGFLPLVLAALLAVLGSVLAAWPGRSLRWQGVTWHDRRHAAAILGLCVAAALALERLGWRLTCFLMLAFLLGVVERLRWWAALPVAAGLALASHYLFVSILKVPLPVGPFPW